MDNNQALKIAIECIAEVAHKYAVDANIFIQMKQKDYKLGKRNHDKYAKYMQAIKVIEGMRIQKKLF
jgi:hypothetical protein